MMKQLMIFYFIISLFVILILFIGCISNNDKPGYEKGTIWIAFKEGVTSDEANNLIIKYNCSVIEFNNYTISTKDGKSTLNAVVKVPEGKEKEYIEIFSKEPIVARAKTNDLDY